MTAAGSKASAAAAAELIRSALREAISAGVAEDAPQRRKAVSLLGLLERAVHEAEVAGPLGVAEDDQIMLRALFERVEEEEGSPPFEPDDKPAAAVAQRPTERYHYR